MRAFFFFRLRASFSPTFSFPTSRRIFFPCPPFLAVRIRPTPPPSFRESSSFFSMIRIMGFQSAQSFSVTLPRQEDFLQRPLGSLPNGRSVLLLLFGLSPAAAGSLTFPSRDLQSPSTYCSGRTPERQTLNYIEVVPFPPREDPPRGPPFLQCNMLLDFIRQVFSSSRKFHFFSSRLFIRTDLFLGFADLLHFPL